MEARTAVTPGVVLSPRRRWGIVAICASALFLVGLDTTIVAVGLSQIGASLGIHAGQLAWVIDAYTVIFASLLITSGALADRYGRRRILQIGLSVFGLASLACALAPTGGLLIVARACQGIGASMLTPVALAIVVNTMRDPKERAQAIGIWSSVFGISMAVGPLAGGALLSAFDWRALFWVNIPLVLIAMVLVATLVPESRGSAADGGRARRLDVPGQVLLIALLGLFVGTLIEAPRVGWASPLAILSYLTVLLLAVIFVKVESRRRQPLIEPSLFRVPAFAGAIVGALAVFIAFSVTLLMTTFLLQTEEGWSPLQTGAAVLSMAIGATVCAPLSGYLAGTRGARLPMVLAGTFLAFGGVLLGVTFNGHLSLLLAAYLSVGIGVGFANAPITNTAVSNLPPERAGVASGTTSTARQLGTAIGAAIAGSLLANVGTANNREDLSIGWGIVMACGLVLLWIAIGLHRRTANRQTGTQS